MQRTSGPLCDCLAWGTPRGFHGATSPGKQEDIGLTTAQAALDRGKTHHATLIRIGVEILALAAGGVLLVSRSGDLQDLGHHLGHLQWKWVVPAAFLELASLLPLAELQRRVLRAARFVIGLWPMYGITLASNAVAVSLPAGAAFGGAYSYTQFKKRGAPGVVAAWAELASGAWSFAALAGLALAGITLAGNELPRVLSVLVLVVFSGALSAAVLFGHPSALRRGYEWVVARARRLIPPSLERRLDKVEHHLATIDAVRPSPRQWSLAALFALLNWAGDAGVLALSFLAVGAPVPWNAVLLAYAVAQLLASLPLTPGGIGVVEGGLIVTLVALGSEPAAAGAAVIVFRGFSFWLLLAAGWVAYAFVSRGRRVHDKRPGKAVPSTDGEIPDVFGLCSEGRDGLTVAKAESAQPAIARLVLSYRGRSLTLLSSPEPPHASAFNRPYPEAAETSVGGAPAFYIPSPPGCRVARLEWRSGEGWHLLAGAVSRAELEAFASDLQTRKKLAV